MLSIRVRASAEVRSQVMARVVDGYTNILTVKLFSRMADEDAWVRESVDAHQDAIAAHMQAITQFMVVLSLLNAGLLGGTLAFTIAPFAARLAARGKAPPHDR